MTKENQVCSFHHHVNALFLVCCCLSIDCMMQHADLLSARYQETVLRAAGVESPIQTKLG